MTNNKDYLSQEEIDALLRQSSDSGSESSMSVLHVEDYLSSLEQDALGEIGNITFGSAATALSTLLGKKVDITTPKVSVVARSELSEEFPVPYVAVHVNYVDGFNGINLLVIKTDDAKVIADLMMGGDGTGLAGDELSEIHISAVQEAMNQMMGSSATSMSTMFNRFVNISPPGIDILNFSSGEGDSVLPPEDVFIKVSFRLIIGDLIDSSIMQLLPVSFAKEMVSILLGGGDLEQELAPVETVPVSSAAETSAIPSNQTPVNDLYNQAPIQPPIQSQQPMQHAMYQQPPIQQPAYQQPMNQPVQPMMAQQGMPYQGQPVAYGVPMNRNVNVQPAEFSNFSPPNLTPTEDTNLNLLLDIPLKVTVELGRTHRVIKDILELSQGSIIELDKLAGEPVDILVNNKLIAKGEVVVIDENFGVRVTDIVNQWDRIQKLQ